MLLALDTATSTVTAAVLHDGVVLAEHAESDPRRHAELLTPVVRRVIGEAGVRWPDLDGVVVGVGPGPFTGLRVGVVTARVLARVHGLAVHGVCSLDALAAEAEDLMADTTEELLVATDARRREVYWARYRRASQGRLERVEGPAVNRAADLDAGDRALPCVGRGPLLYPEALRDAEPAGGHAVPRDVSAGALAQVADRALREGDGAVLLPPDPLYLRRPDAAVPTAARATAVGP